MPRTTACFFIFFVRYSIIVILCVLSFITIVIITVLACAVCLWRTNVFSAVCPTQLNLCVAVSLGFISAFTRHANSQVLQIICLEHIEAETARFKQTDSIQGISCRNSTLAHLSTNTSRQIMFSALIYGRRCHTFTHSLLRLTG